MQASSSLGGGEEEQTKAIEGLPLAERAKLLEGFNFFEGLSAGWLIDALDTVNTWCVARVIDCSNGSVHVNFDGWSSKYDEVLWLGAGRGFS